MNLSNKPINQHSLQSLESWLTDLGAVKDANNQQLVGNRRPFSNGEMFSLFLLIIIIFTSLFLAIVIASFTGKELESIPTWLLR